MKYRVRVKVEGGVGGVSSSSSIYVEKHCLGSLSWIVLGLGLGACIAFFSVGLLRLVLGLLVLALVSVLVFVFRFALVSVSLSLCLDPWSVLSLAL